jgi:hypothetical protein
MVSNVLWSILHPPPFPGRVDPVTLIAAFDVALPPVNLTLVIRHFLPAAPLTENPFAELKVMLVLFALPTLGAVPLPAIVNDVTFEKPLAMSTDTADVHVALADGRLIVTSPVLLEASDTHAATSDVDKDDAVPVLPTHEQAA